MTAAKAGKVLFLREAAISFLEYTGKENGNKLEQSVFQKLQDPLNNNVCETILGLNDYLSMVVPNLHQMSKSNLVQAKKNQTMK